MHWELGTAFSEETLENYRYQKVGLQSESKELCYNNEVL